jgi:DNA-directed RNA polymerase subunit alpha
MSEDVIAAAAVEEPQDTTKPIRLDRFEIPNRLVKKEETASGYYAQFVAEPFEPGYGHTIGNSLRRVLLSSLEGAAITSVRIAGVQHEFSTLPGVVEDVTDIILNLKKVRFRHHDKEPRVLSIKLNREGSVTHWTRRCRSTASSRCRSAGASAPVRRTSERRCPSE